MVPKELRKKANEITITRYLQTANGEQNLNLILAYFTHTQHGK